MEGEVEVGLWMRKRRKELDDEFGWLFPGTVKYEMYNPVKTKLDADIEEILKL